jgi:hypothetical protein
MLQKNTAGKWIVFAFDITDNTAKTGDAAQITANVRIDGGAANAVDDTNPTELEDGYYIFDITAAECNGDQVLITPASSTGSIQVIGVPGSMWTSAPNYNLLGIESDGDITKVNLCANTTLVDTTTTNTDQRGTDSAATAASLTTAQNDLDIITGASGVNLLTATQASIDAIETDTSTTIPGTITTAQADLDIITGASGVNLLTATQASIDAIEADTNELQADDVPGLIAALNNLSSADVLTTALTESYGTDGSAHTLSQLLYLVNAAVSEFAIASTTKTTKKLDGSTTAATYTLDDATNPTSITRAT